MVTVVYKINFMNKVHQDGPCYAIIERTQIYNSSRPLYNSKSDHYLLSCSQYTYDSWMMQDKQRQLEPITLKLSDKAIALSIYNMFNHPSGLPMEKFIAVEHQHLTHLIRTYKC
jgi:hypothetical protein